MSLALSSSWKLVQFSIPNLGYLVIFPRATFEKPEPVSLPRRLPIRMFVLLHPFPPLFHVCSRILEPGSSFSFRLTEDQGAALVTKYLTHREDVQLAGTFEKYAKDHYDSWVTFARETGHGNDVKPVLVTGVDMTRDFAMMSYSNNDDNLTSEFTTSAPGAGSVWGAWRTTGPVNTNCGPYLSHPPSPTQTMNSSSSGTGHASTIPDEYNQSVLYCAQEAGDPKGHKSCCGSP